MDTNASPSVEPREAGPGPDLEHDAERIDQLLDQIQAMAGPSTWQGVEELVERLVRLYGAGLERTLAHARKAGVDASQFDDRLGADELVSSLLLLHGLHPVPALVRVERALDRVRPALGSHAGGVELVGVDDGGVVRLRLLGSCHGCPSSRATVEQTLRRAIEAAAPDVTRIEVEEEAPAASAPLKLPVLTGAAQVRQSPLGESR